MKNIFFIYLAVHPPSIINEVPVIIDAASEAKKVIAVATSLSVAILPNGIFDNAYFLNDLFAKYFFALGVATKVGHTLFTLMFEEAKSIDIPLVKPSKPNLVIL